MSRFWTFTVYKIQTNSRPNFSTKLDHFSYKMVKARFCTPDNSNSDTSWCLKTGKVWFSEINCMSLKNIFLSLQKFSYFSRWNTFSLKNTYNSTCLKFGRPFVGISDKIKLFSIKQSKLVVKNALSGISVWILDLGI